MNIDRDTRRRIRAEMFCCRVKRKRINTMILFRQKKKKSTSPPPHAQLTIKKVEKIKKCFRL